MRCGSGLRRFCRDRPRIRSERRTTACFLGRCCGGFARVHHGGIFQPALTTGTISSGGFAGGCKKGFLAVLSVSYRRISICRSYRWMARSCRRTRRHRSLKRRSDEQDGRADGRNWKTDPFCRPARPEPRSHRDTGAPGPGGVHGTDR